MGCVRCGKLLRTKIIFPDISDPQILTTVTSTPFLENQEGQQICGAQILSQSQQMQL